MTGAIFLAYTVPFIPRSTVAGRTVRPWGVRRCMVVGMISLAFSFAVFAFISPTTGVLIVIGGLILHSVGQAYAYNISTTAAMDMVSEEKAGEVSGLVSSVRMMAIVFGVAITGALFKILEKNKMFELFAAVGRQLTNAERSEVKGLLSGSVTAQAKLAALAPSAAREVQRIVLDSFVHALNGVMILCLVLSILGIGSALLVRGKYPAALTASEQKQV